jgi:hypothetical protein
VPDVDRPSRRSVVVHVARHPAIMAACADAFASFAPLASFRHNGDFFWLPVVPLGEPEDRRIRHIGGVASRVLAVALDRFGGRDISSVC